MQNQNHEQDMAVLAEYKAVLELPAGTTCYLADIHGQGNKFFHIINNKAGTVKRKINEVLPDLDPVFSLELLKLCYYPKQFLKMEENLNSFHFSKTTEYIISLAKLVSHTGSKLTRKDFDFAVSGTAFPAIISELVSNSNQDKSGTRTGTYQQALIRSLHENGIHFQVILDLTLIFRSQLVHKYIINGDIPDRGRDTSAILDFLIDTPEIDINWGNHDLLWMGAAAGSRELICDLVRVQLRYGHSIILEEDYSISLLRLKNYALETYTTDPASGFFPGSSIVDRNYTSVELAKMQKVVAVILWKLEASRNKELNIEAPLESIFKNKNDDFYCTINKKQFRLLDQELPTINPEFPAQLTLEEGEILFDLVKQFKANNKLQVQMKHIAKIGSLYKLHNRILSFHAIIPVDGNGKLAAVNILGREYKGKALFDTLTSIYKSAFEMKDPPQAFLDLFYQGWKGRNSWTFGKMSMQTFSRIMVKDPDTHIEEKAPYYAILNDPVRGKEMIVSILNDFSDDQISSPVKIYNGHIPVRIDKEEAPVKADGLVICGDGGFSEAYGDVGFVMVSTSRRLFLNRLGSGVSVEDVLNGGADILPVTIWEEIYSERLRLKDCNIGAVIRTKIEQIHGRQIKL
ncbi:MAG: fructose-bisphosphatase class III [Spirochaetales bacterium]|nr:fructose-bisphosphatase class III [Spirochaetales bacterium]